MRIVDCGVGLRGWKGLVNLGCQGCCQYLEPSEGAAGASEGKAPGQGPDHCGGGDQLWPVRTG